MFKCFETPTNTGRQAGADGDGQRPFQLPGGLPSLETILFAVAILLPLSAVGWRLVGDRRSHEAALAASESEARRVTTVATVRREPEETILPAPDADLAVETSLPSPSPAKTAPVVARRENAASVKPRGVNQPRVEPMTPPSTAPVTLPASANINRNVAIGASPSSAAVAPAGPIVPAGQIVPAGKIVPAGQIVPAGSVVPAGRIVPPLAAAPASAPASGGEARQASVAAVAVATDAEIERLLGEAWGLIERGDYDSGRSRLQDARKKNRADPRADFSLGLLDSLVSADWPAAEKRFADCVRRDLHNVPSLNNLAIAELHNKREMEAAKHWKAIVDQRAATVEVVQNLGRVRYLAKRGEIRKNPSVTKLIDELYTEAAVATAQSSKPEAGFRLMALQLADGRAVGWADVRRKMVDTSSFSTTPPASASRRMPIPTAAPVQGTPISGYLIPNPVAPYGLQPPLPNQPGASGYLPSNPNGAIAPRPGNIKH